MVIVFGIENQSWLLVLIFYSLQLFGIVSFSVFYIFFFVCMCVYFYMDEN